MNRWFAVAILLPILSVHGADPSPYSGEEQRDIKSMSTAEIEALRRGDGMGFAKAAELNRYPGPRHVLELADELELSSSQREKTEQLFAAMQADAAMLGEQLIAAEAALDRLFDSGAVDATVLESQLVAIGNLRARLRFVHLNAHLRQKEILNPHQVGRYVALRGYQQPT